METLTDILRDILKPLIQEAVAESLKGRNLAPKETASQEYLSPKAIEAIYGLNSKTLSGWRRKGRGPAFSKDGSLILYRCQDVENYLKSRRVRTIEQPGLREKFQ